ncbi:MAG TPA: hypothetical protein VK021_09820 [Flavobacteriaceae bacterium]|nr:hypothetical protein [Flavobacteriaceae bacterium]
MICILFNLSTLSAQEAETSDLAENLFEKNHKWGITLGYSSLYVSNQQNSISYELVNSRAFNFGFVYNMVQLGNFNVNVGLVYKKYLTESYSSIKKEDGYSSAEILDKVDWGPNKQFDISLEIEYLFPFKPGNEKFTGFLGLGTELSFHKKMYGYGTSGLSDPDEPIGFVEVFDFDHIISVGVNFTAGTNIQVGNAFMLRPFITYHYQPDNLYTVTVNTVGLRVSPHTISQHRITGNYLKFGLNIIPGRGLF